MISFRNPTFVLANWTTRGSRDGNWCHGMSDKSMMMASQYSLPGERAGVHLAKERCPSYLSDFRPFVHHHGALGGFLRVHLGGEIDEVDDTVHTATRCRKLTLHVLEKRLRSYSRCLWIVRAILSPFRRRTLLLGVGERSITYQRCKVIDYVRMVGCRNRRFD